MGFNVLNILFQSLRHYESNGTLKVDGFDFEDENALLINTFKNNKIYCIDIAMSGNNTAYLSDDTIDFIFNDFRKESNAQLVNAIMKKGEYVKNYLFSFNKDLLSLIAKHFGVELIPGHKIMDVLYDLYFDNEYILKNKRLESNICVSQEIEYENLTHAFHTLTKEAVYKNLKDVTLYQGVEYKTVREQKSRDYQSFLKKDFQGIIWTYIAFDKSTVLATLYRKKNQALMEGKQSAWNDRIDLYKNQEEDIGVINTIIFAWGEHNKKNLLDDAQKFLQCSFSEKNRFRDDLIKFTPLKKRDILQGNKPLNKKLFCGLFCSFLKQDSKRPAFHAHGPIGEFLNFDLKYPSQEKGTAPHFLFLGPTRSGKTVNLQKTLSLIIDYDWNTRKAKSLFANHMRLFDVKNSMLNLTNEIARNNDVSKMQTDLNYFRYNLVNIDTTIVNNRIVLDETDMALTIMLTNFILNARGKGDKLTSSESEIFKNTIREIYKKGDIEGVFLKTLAQKSKELYAELISLGYKPTDKTNTIKEERFAHLKKPCLNDVIKKLQEYISEKERYNEEDLSKHAKSLKAKLSTIAMMGHWSNYDQIDLKNGEYLYVDFNLIKDDPENFIPIYFAVFSRMYRADKKRQEALRLAGKPRPLIHYVWEEAYNFFIVPEFAEGFEKLGNEAASHGIILGFVTQLIDHVPQSMLKQFRNKFFLFPGEEVRQDASKEGKSKSDIINDIAKLGPPQSVLYNCDRVPKYGMVVWHEFGSFVMKYELGQDITEEQMEIFESEADQITA